MTLPPEPPRSSASRIDLMKIVGWMTVAVLSFTTMALSVREVVRWVGLFEALAVRNGVTVIALLGIAAAAPALRRQLRPARMPLHAVRNGVQFAGQYAWALAVTVLPLATVVSLEFATPIFAAILAVLLLRERATIPRIAAIVVGAIGIVVIHGSSRADAGWLLALPLLAAFCFAFSDIVTKRLTTSQSAFTILFWMNVLQLPLNLVGTGGVIRFEADPLAFLALAGVCIGGSLGHFALTKALSHGDAIVVVPLDFLRIPLVALVAAWLYGETVASSTFTGAAILAIGVVISLGAEARIISSRFAK